MKLVGALLSGINVVNFSAQQKETSTGTAELPDVCEKLPDELNSVLDLIG